MFDWNDKELSNILWGEAGESEDHIVPFQDGSEVYHKKKEWSQDGTTAKPNGQRTFQAKGDFHVRKLKGNMSFKRDEGTSTSGLTLGSWPELSSSSVAKNDQDSLGSEVSNNLYNSSVETAELDKEPENFQNALEGKEQSDFDDYTWDNIGSFDDLDQIISDDDPIFRHVNLDSAEELWPSSKEVTNSPVKTFPITAESSSFELGALRDTSRHLDTKTKYEQSDDPPFIPNYAKVKHHTSHGLKNVPDQVEYPGVKSKSTVKKKRDLVTGGKATALNSRPANEKAGTPYQLTDKAGGQKKPLKNRKKPERKAEKNLVQDYYGVWNPSVQYEALQYHHIPGPFIAHPAYGNLANPYPMMPVMSHIHSGEFKHPPVRSGYEVFPPMNKSVDTPAKTLTPQEKIEKLRRRQQMQAMLAIQKQQQQLGHQASCSDHPVSQIQNVEGSACNGEDLSTLPSLDANSPLKQDDSNTISVAIDDHSAEETILYRLQDVISKLDVRTRHGIRDSLFRLAQSATLRNYASDGRNTIKRGRDEQEVTEQKELGSDDNRYTKMPDTETETNPIDRIVAHLLFQKPMDLPDKYLETSESQKKSHQRSENPWSSGDLQLVDQFKNSPKVDTSENTSNYSPGDGGALEIEASRGGIKAYQR